MSAITSNQSAFQKASREVLSYLAHRHPMSLWMVTRANGDEWIVLDSNDRLYGVKGGQVFKWSDSFCSRMVKGEGPRIAPDSNQIEVYRSAPIGQQVEIAAYVGIPLYDHHQEFFGTLCAIDPCVQDQELTHSLPELELIASLLMHVYQGEVERSRVERRSLALANESWTDTQTGAHTLRAWEYDIRSADLEIAVSAHPGGVIVIQHEFATADAAAFVANLQSKLGPYSRIYKMGIHEFAILMCNIGEVKQHAVLTLLQGYNEKLCIGYHSRRAAQNFLDCYQLAKSLAHYSMQAAA
ncbi:MAG: GAF domain-containing protein [Armatimonadota bacterium]